jgi:hypothetical protein
VTNEETVCVSLQRARGWATGPACFVANGGRDRAGHQECRPVAHGHRAVPRRADDQRTGDAEIGSLTAEVDRSGSAHLATQRHVAANGSAGAAGEGNRALPRVADCNGTVDHQGGSAAIDGDRPGRAIILAQEKIVAVADGDGHGAAVQHRQQAVADRVISVRSDLPEFKTLGDELGTAAGDDDRAAAHLECIDIGRERPDRAVDKFQNAAVRDGHPVRHRIVAQGGGVG